MSTLLRNKLVRLMSIAFLTAFMLIGLASIFAPSVPAHAATHQQQNIAQPAIFTNRAVGFAAYGNNGNPDRLWDAYVYGYNQDNNYAAWHGNAGGNTYFITSNWWWHGNVHIDVWDGTTNSWHHEDAFVSTPSTEGICWIYR